MNAIDEVLRSLAISGLRAAPAGGTPREPKVEPEPEPQRAARAIFRKWLVLRRHGIRLGLPLTDPLQAPYGAWYRVYGHGRVYWHPDFRMDARLGAFHRVDARIGSAPADHVEGRNR